MNTPNPALDVITIGEAMVLFAAQQAGPLDDASSFTRTTAGAELNVAIGLARLGLRTGYLTRLGQDLFGRHIAAVLEREGIDHQQVVMDPEHPTGFMLKSRSDDGSDPQIQYFRKGSAASHMQVGELSSAYGNSARHLHLTGIFVGVTPSTREVVFELAARSRAAGLSISFDPNLRPTLWRSKDEMVACLNQLSTYSDWVLPGIEEGRLLTGRDSVQGIADFYLERGAKGVVVKLGPDGAFCATPTERGHVPGVPVPRVVDTVGAGDGFAVGVISGLLEGLSPAGATARGNAIGARVVQFPGDADGLPTRAELNALLKA
ncbi:sugar kinase [Hydrogenophaga sp. SL48]|uniref:sugar kinase n=1 Tax=Hydrogenophaga sp. SL48 TaxID=2806347 RepID=UPI001F340DE4|nr:sugar kinase [Hydrogenophaga sp. SL48]UJW83356.1 sugar kinase [Hydrogenophaga sp. SL48]